MGTVYNCLYCFIYLFVVPTRTLHNSACARIPHADPQRCNRIISLSPGSDVLVNRITGHNKWVAGRGKLRRYFTHPVTRGLASGEPLSVIVRGRALRRR